VPADSSVDYTHKDSKKKKKKYCVYIHMYIRLFSREKGCVSLFSVTSDSISMV